MEDRIKMGARPALLQGELSDGAVPTELYTEELTQALLDALIIETTKRGMEALQDEHTSLSTG